MPMQSRSSIESAGAELVIGGGRTRAVPLLPLQWNPWTVAATVLVLLLAIPILVVVIGALSGGGETWRHLTSTVLPERSEERRVGKESVAHWWASLDN